MPMRARWISTTTGNKNDCSHTRMQGRSSPLNAMLALAEQTEWRRGTEVQQWANTYTYASQVIKERETKCNKTQQHYRLFKLAGSAAQTRDWTSRIIVVPIGWDDCEGTIFAQGHFSLPKCHVCFFAGHGLKVRERRKIAAYYKYN